MEEVVSEETKSEEEVELADTATMGQKNALRSAENYLDFSAFSYEGLIKQLEFEEYSHEDADSLCLIFYCEDGGHLTYVHDASDNLCKYTGVGEVLVCKG